MADTAYTYSISTDFSSGVAPAKFEDEVIALGLTSANYLYIEIDDDAPDDCEVWFDDPLSGADETSLDGAVAAHDGVPYQDVEEALEAMSIENTYLQQGGSTDELVKMGRDSSGNMTFADDVVPTSKTLTELLAGAALLGRAIFKTDGGLVYTTAGDVLIKEVE